jgi:hypothetical protein
MQRPFAVEKAVLPSQDVRHCGQYALSMSVVVEAGVVGREVLRFLDAVAWYRCVRGAGYDGLVDV